MDAADRIGEPRVARGWLITFADLLCLLLTFFVMLSSMQKVDVVRWAGVSDSLSRRLAPDHAASDLRPRAERNAGVLSTRSVADLGYLASILGEKLRDSPALAGAKLSLAEDRLFIALPAEPGMPQAAALAAALGNIGNAVAVEARAEEGRVTAMQRAAALAVALKAAGYPREVQAAGRTGARGMRLIVRQGKTAP